MKKKVAVKAATKHLKSSAVRGAPAKPGAAASKAKRGAPKAFSAKQVPLEKLPVRNRSFEQYGNEARQMFVEQNISAAQISTRLPVSANTVRIWAKRHGWEAARQARLASPKARLADLEEMFQAMVTEAHRAMKKSKRLPNEKFWDNVSKALAGLERLSGDAYFAAHLTRFVDGFSKYVSANNPELIPALTKSLAGYTATVLSSR